jgi:predicted nucleic acid-binding protein
VKEPVVSDSTCLIGLERIGELNILPALFDPVMIPPEVEREFGSEFSWLRTENLTSSPLVAALRLVVDAGEAEAIALASEKAYLLISDDKQARIAAKRLGVSVIGTIGVLVRAKQSGIISALNPILDSLESNNFFISRALREEALKLVAE